jgi:phage terminase large subunit-like protein
VTEGQVLTSHLVRLACERHLDDLGSAGTRGLRFDPQAAQHAIAFFGFLRHSKGEWAGQTFTLSPWQAFVVGCLFGWKRADGLRRFRTAYCAVPRKNGKSTLSAGIGLYLLVADGEQGAEVYSAATTRDQARIVFDEANGPKLARAAAPGRGADQQPERRGERLALHAAVLQCQHHGRPERPRRDH